jgi:hypothetical protein
MFLSVRLPAFLSIYVSVCLSIYLLINQNGSPLTWLKARLAANRLAGSG